MSESTSIVTKEFCQMIKVSDTVTFWVEEETKTCKVKLYKEITPKAGGFVGEKSEATQEFFFPAFVRDYSKDRCSNTNTYNPYYLCAYFHLSTYYKFQPNGQWQAFGLLVRPGDELEFSVYASSGNQYTHELGLHHDQIHVTIWRTGKDNKKHRVLNELLLEDSICPSNTARAVRNGNRKPIEN